MALFIRSLFVFILFIDLNLCGIGVKVLYVDKFVTREGEKGMERTMVRDSSIMVVILL